MNTAEFNFDGGDCCRSTCAPSPLHQCRADNFDCKDPVELDKEVCPVVVTQSHKNGKCDLGVRNTARCDFDGGDCCKVKP